MFQQVVYTRCKPRRELLDVTTGKLSDGKVINEEGYAIHNFSEGVLSEEKIYDPLFLENIMKKASAIKETGSGATGIFSSYEYYYNEKGNSYLGHDYAFDYNPSYLRINGKTHRPNEHVKQLLVGEYKIYPCMFFGNKVWSAYKETHNFYYHDNGEPLVYLDELDETIEDIIVTRDKVREFINNGRQECTKHLVSVVINEMSKKIEDRKFIVIKDFPENVELWIAAVEYSLPVYLAKKISFNTNITVESEKLLQNIYYVDDKEKTLNLEPKKAEEIGGQKRYYSMIVGIHPNHNDSKKIISGMNNTNFIYLDGENKTIDSNSIDCSNRNYFSAVEKMDEDIADFDGLLEELAELSFGSSSSDIYELFDAYKYLLDSSSNTQDWEYSKMKRYLAIFKKYESVPFKWSQYLAEKTYTVYQKYFDQDYKEGFALLKQIISMDHQVKLKDSIEQYLIDKYMYEIKSKDIDVSFVTGLNKLINVIYSDIPVKLAQEFSANIDSFIDLSSSWNSEQAYYIFEKLYESNNIPGINNAEWHKEEKNVLLIDELFNTISEEPKSSSDMLNYLKNAPIYLEIAVKGVKKDFQSWSKYICDTVVDSKLEMVCGALLEIEGVTEGQYEAFLIMLLKAGKQTSILFKYVIKSVEKYSLREDSAIDFVKEYLNTYARRWNELKNLIDIMSENDLGEKTEGYAYDVITKMISESSIDNSIIPMIKEYEKWRMGLKQPQGRAYNVVLGESLIKRSAEQVVEILDKYLAKGEIELTDVDMKYIMSALDLNVKNQEIFVKFYKLIKSNSSAIKGQLISFDFENADSVLWYLRLFLTKPIPDWQMDFRGEIKEIEEFFYNEIRNENVDRVEKLIIKELDKDSSEIKVYKDYFEKMRSQIKEDKAKEKQKAKEAKREAAENSEKKGLFGKMFGKK